MKKKKYLKLKKKGIKFQFNQKNSSKPLVATAKLTIPPEEWHNSNYYAGIEDRITNRSILDQEKRKLSAPETIEVDEGINKYLEKALEKPKGMPSVLKKIYEKNKKYVTEGLQPPIHKDIMGIIAHPDMLLLGYRHIKSNKGAMTKGYTRGNDKIIIDQNKQTNRKLKILPDGVNLELLKVVSQALKQDKYKWGISKRIWIPKPGKAGLRPITIPVFVDRIVQASILLTLESIYEPWFERENCSFGFRSKKSCHDAITQIGNYYYTNGMTVAIEGDVKGAYDNVNHDILIAILRERIKDNRFFRMLKGRLKIKLFDTEKKTIENSFLGIPQGGIDSPYLFNIYLNKLDKYVNNIIKPELEQENLERLKNKYTGKTLKTVPENPKYAQLIRDARKKAKQIKDFKNKMKKGFVDHKMKLELYKLIKEKKKIIESKLKTPYTDNNRNKIRILYVRYADDWIILSNMNKVKALEIKEKIKIFLKENLGLELAEDKTLITSLKESPAKFLGFEIKATTSRKVVNFTATINESSTTSTTKESKTRTKNTLKRIAGFTLGVYPDNQRLLNRLYMKGYCRKDGFPKALPWLAALEGFTIIEKFNQVMRGLANYYTEFTSTPSALNRWLYIVRWSCIHTLANKYKLKITKLFNKYGNGNGSISIPVKMKVGNKVWEKSWTLLKESESRHLALSLNRREEIETIDNLLRIGEWPRYKKKVGQFPKVKEYDFLEAINWVNLRTKASMDLFCCICGSDTDIQMHHVKHVRKSNFSEENNSITKAMALRNRKQIPVCQTCHNWIHTGKYRGDQKLGSLIEDKMNKEGGFYERRLFTLENHINPSPYKPAITFDKQMAGKGWRLIKAPDLKIYELMDKPLFDSKDTSFTETIHSRKKENKI